MFNVVDLHLRLRIIGFDQFCNMKYAFRKLLFNGVHNMHFVTYFLFSTVFFTPHIFIWYVALDLFYVTHFKITGHDKSLFVPKEWVEFVPRVWAEKYLISIRLIFIQAHYVTELVY